MYILKIIPLTKIPRSQPPALTYYTSSKLSAGSLVLIPLHQRKALGLVINIDFLKNQKMYIKKADYQLKSILEIISPEPILTPKQIALAQWMSDYYWCPLGVALKSALPQKLDKLKHLISQSPIEPSHLQTPQTLILMPEISKIQAAAVKFNKNDTVILHNQLTPKQRLETWLKIRNSQTKTIIGARSAVFAPFQNLAKIIVENEENPHYKSSQQSPLFDARQAALKLTELYKAKIIFHSSAPTIERYYFYKNLFSRDKTASSKKQPQVKLIDMKQEIKQGNFSILSRALQKKIKQTLKQKGQIILFINRRGAATFILCRDCGYIAQCPHCHTSLVYHLQSGSKLICHYCQYQEKPPALCPQCQSHRIKFFGTGTEKIEMEVRKMFPRAKIARLDSDLTPQTKDQEIVARKFNDKKTDVLIGTQLIFSQNLNSPSLVAMISADTLLRLPDFHSSEKTFQIIQKLIRLSKNDCFIQTYLPENQTLQYAVQSQYQKFYQEEIKMRQMLDYPPFSRIIKLIYQDKKDWRAEQEAKILFEKLKFLNYKLQNPADILGPVPAFIHKKQDKYIWHIIIKLKPKNQNLKIELLKIIPSHWVIDVDPENLL